MPFLHHFVTIVLIGNPPLASIAHSGSVKIYYLFDLREFLGRTCRNQLGFVLVAPLRLLLLALQIAVVGILRAPRIHYVLVQVGRLERTTGFR